MRDLLAAWKGVRALLEEAESVHGAVSQRTEPTFVDVVLPLAYKHLVSGRLSDAPDTNALVGIAGHYLGQRYPELREYVLTDAQRSRLGDLRTHIDEILRGDGG